MSNELRVERENIKTRNTNKDGTDAFINREVTLKYNDELDEVAQVRFILPFLCLKVFD